MTERPSLTYRDAGVDIDAGEELVDRIKPRVARTHRPEVLAGVGGFGAMIELPEGRWRRPVLVAGTDGVGTKLRLAIDTGLHDGVGQDLVAMCANDVVVQGAEPLFFLDYYATGRLSVEVAERVIAGIAEGCLQAGCALVGGETAEMPGMYAEGDYDLAGFCVGVVERERIIDGSRTRAGDVVLGLASSGPHSNGFSLIRRLIAETKSNGKTLVDGARLFDLLMAPTRIYVKSLLRLAAAIDVHALAHITGGGLSDNIPRVLPEGLGVRIDSGAWQRDPVWDWIQKSGRITDVEMHRTFNCGIGMVAVLPRSESDAAMEFLRVAGERATIIGEVVAGAGVKIG
ncbi:MAG TPA: phosphoribosylformylglycinamidine cyclo-ligase [Vicinamibacterales bacterium]|nr:phosphoribosylformylglycinamidine cyclo-ligase [Vicinamibacterales bacterium]